MPVEIERLREPLDAGNFADLLIRELGWDHPQGTAQEVSHPDDGTIARQIATKRGIGVWISEEIPSPAARRRLDTVVGRRNREHLLVFCEDNRQIWHWPEQRQSGTGYRLVSHEHYAGTRNEALLQRLASASFSLEEEEGLTVIDVLGRVRQSFNAEAVTKKFYNDFKTHQEQLTGQIEGIPFEKDTAWYTSVLLNRLMLVYFLQKKGFLDGDLNYLRNRLTMVREHLGTNAFYGFFLEFLLPFFHDGLGSHLHEYDDPAIKTIVGDVPYINGGVFKTHELESQYEIQIPDEAFEAIFSFFDQYRWHLDERPTNEANEINPDVLGYVFEQYVNSKEMGAFYTKEDVTGYMTTMAIIPSLFDKLDNGRSQPWDLLLVDPDRYIPESVRHGIDEDLPPEIAIGLNEPDSRELWSEKADPLIGLPGETWWEAMDRHKHCEGTRKALSRKEVQDVSNALVHNLDLRLLAQDFLASLSDRDSLVHAHDQLKSLSVLDPTCGSGAFLFAALELLVELYTVVFERAEELAASSDDPPDFLAEVDQHPNTRYHILRMALLNNLYGVDLMEEAVEIARLRLFLTLAAQIETKEQIEPFPDLDFNIKAGNLLIGVASSQDARDRLAADLLGQSRLEEINEAAKEISDLYNRHVAYQATTSDPATVGSIRTELLDGTASVRNQLDQFLHDHRGVTTDLDQWVQESQPFHWFIEFPHVFQTGGFDVVIGNPPYIARKRIPYEYNGYVTDQAKDVFAPCMERAVSLLNDRGRYSMIVPIAFQFSKDYNSARSAIRKRLSEVFVSTYSRRPSSLFSEVGVRSTIVTGAISNKHLLHTTTLRRWWPDYRPHLFATNRYTPIDVGGFEEPWPRPGPNLIGLFEALTAKRQSVANSVRRTGPELGFKQTALYYLSIFIDEPPAWTPEGTRTEQTMVGWLRFENETHRDVAWMLLSGRLGVWWWAATGDDFDVTASLLTSFPIAPSQVEDVWPALGELARQLRAEQQKHPLVTLYAGKEMGNYDMSRCRHITDRADQLVLEELGLSEYWPAILEADHQINKATGEPTGTRREWPFPL